MMKIKKVQSSKDLRSIEKLAFTIWNEHYVPIIGQQQVNYMLDKFQSQDAMAKQIDEGLEYYIFYWDNTPVGYLGYKEENDKIFLSKIYVLSTYRGKKIGKGGIDFVFQIATQKDKKGIRLTVNKYNSKSIEAYLKLGFEITEEVIADIGEGYVMDDYVLVKTIEK